MTDIHVPFNYEELQLVKRVLGFGVVDVPIVDPQGNKIYPNIETKDLAQDLIERLDRSGIEDKKGLYSSFDPVNDLSGKTVQIQQNNRNDKGYDLVVQGLVTRVLGDDREGWSVELDDITVGPYTRDDLKVAAQIVVLPS